MFAFVHVQIMCIRGCAWLGVCANGGLRAGRRAPCEEMRSSASGRSTGHKRQRAYRWYSVYRTGPLRRTQQHKALTGDGVGLMRVRGVSGEGQDVLVILGLGSPDPPYQRASGVTPCDTPTTHEHKGDGCVGGYAWSDGEGYTTSMSWVYTTNTAHRVRHGCTARVAWACDNHTIRGRVEPTDHTTNHGYNVGAHGCHDDPLC